MKRIVSIITDLPRWYGIGVVLLYSLVLAEFFVAMMRLSIPAELVGNSLLTTISRLTYGLTIASGVAGWLIMAFLFHLMALLLGGNFTFGRFAAAAAYPYVIPAICTVASIMLLDGLQVPPTVNVVEFLTGHSTFKLAMGLLNYSSLPYYVACVVLIRYLYGIKYLYALLSVAIPVGAIWLISQLVRLV
jgi:hypothetical protein